MQMRLSGGKLRDFMPPWYDTDDEADGMWALFGRLQEQGEEE